MHHFRSFIRKTATRQRITLLLMFYAAVFGAILVTMSQLVALTGGYGILDFDRGYDLALVNEVLGSYEAEGMALYARIQVLDILNPALYSLLMANFAWFLWRDTRFEWLAVLPLFAGLSDYAENIALFLIVRTFPDISGILVATSSTLSLVKNASLGVAVAVLLLGIVLRMAAFFGTARR